MTSYLADTHLALWLIDGSDNLPIRARELMEDPRNEWYLSIVSVWEVMLKHQVKPEKMLIDAETFLEDCKAAGFKILGLEPEHVFMAGKLPLGVSHKDPFDRMLLAQARAERLTLATHDQAFEVYGDSCMLVL